MVSGRNWNQNSGKRGRKKPRKVIYIFITLQADHELFVRTAQEKLANIQEKLQNKNLSNKRRKELKKSKNKIAGDERKRKERKDTGNDDELVITNIQTLTI